MAKTWDEIQAQITKLNKQAEALKAKEAVDVAQRIKTAIDHYGFTVADLFGANVKTAARRGNGKAVGRKKAARPPSRVKFRDDAGHTWSGHGKRPNWYKQAIADGKTPEDLTVKD